MNARDDIRIWSLGVVLAFLAGALLLAGLVPSVVSAQYTAQRVDSGWLPWVGCWEAADGGEEAPMLCVRPASENRAIEFITWAEGEVISTETILADGVSRDSNREGCVGFEAAQFSEDGQRVYLSSEYVCEDGVAWGATGVLAMMNPMEWVDIKVVGEEGERTPWVLRYRLASASKVEAAGMTDLVAPMASQVKTARIIASARITEDDLIEAVGKVDPEAVEALIMERGDPFDINAENLVRLADAGVPVSVIDLAVAMSYPDQFAVKRGGMGAVSDVTNYGLEPRRSFDMGFGAWGMGYGYGYSGYGYGYGSGYGYGYPYGYGYYQPYPVIVQPISGVPDSRMVKGSGYTRGGPGGYGGQAGSRGGGSSAGSSGGGGSQAVSAPGGVRTSGGSSGGRVAGARGRGGGGGGSI